MLHADTRSLRDKALLATAREYDRLMCARRDAEIIPLAHPYQNGWEKWFALRDDANRREDGWVLRSILKIFNTSVYCRKKDFLDAKGKPLPHHLKVLPKKQVEEFRWPARYFKWLAYGHWEQETSYPPYGRYRSWYATKHSVLGYRFAVPDYYLIDDIRPYIVTHTKVIMPEVESRLKEISNKFTYILGWNRLGQLKGQKQNFFDIKEHRKVAEQTKVSLDPDQW